MLAAKTTEHPRESQRQPAEAFFSPGRAGTTGGGSPLVPWQRESEAPAPLATTPFVIGHERRADVVWTRHEFLSLCGHMLNGNEPDFFMLAFRDKEGSARFAKAKEGKTFMERRASWAWDTVTGRAKSPSGIGFYPRNAEGKTRWAAMDFDAHGPEQTERERARRLAFDAFHYFLHRHPQLFIALATSGGGGWHLFLFTEDFHPCEEWILLMRQVADWLGTPIQKGTLEIFPSESRGAVGYGIRAPGTWNPKTGECGKIVFENLRPLFLKGSLSSSHPGFSPHCSKEDSSSSQREREREDHFLAQGNGSASPCKSREAMCHFPDRAKSPIGEMGQFAIRAPRTRHDQLARFVAYLFRQVSREVAEAAAVAQYHDAAPAPRSDLAEHLQDFCKIWDGLQAAFESELTEKERAAFAALNTGHEREAFKILRSFAKHAKGGDFPVAAENFAARIGLTRRGACYLRRKFCELGILRQTAPAVTNRAAARYQWTADRETFS